MNLTESLVERYLNDLQSGMKYPVKISGEWQHHYLSYQTILKAYCTLAIPRHVFLSKYKSVPPIETIDNEEKIGWRKFVNETFPGTPPEFRLEALKIIYTIGILTS